MFFMAKMAFRQPLHEPQLAPPMHHCGGSLQRRQRHVSVGRAMQGGRNRPHRATAWASRRTIVPTLISHCGAMPTLQVH